jgi:FAD synthetase
LQPTKTVSFQSKKISSRLASVMTPHQDNGRKANSSNLCDSDSLPKVFPNWRNVDIHATDTEKSTICTPFCHPLDPAKASSSSSASASATAASWSDSALQSGLDLYERIKSCTDPYISPALTSAIHDLEMAYRLYGPFCMVGSYNGGKDAVVIFHLMRAVHAYYCNEMQQKAASCMIPRPRVIYFQHPDEFPEVLDLLQDTVGLYDLDMLAFKEGVSFGEGLKYLVSRNFAPGTDGLSYYGENNNDETMRLPPPHPLAFILGTRSNDPNAGSQGVYAPSSHYMPPFLRVNPILDWNYGQVWHFLRTFQLPYCKLYDDGFTSLGTVKDTLPCPALKKDNDEYWPAYMLRDWDQERAGRISKKKPQTEDVVETENVEKSVTMSQTSSTVSLGNGNEQGAATQSRTRTMSSEINTDELPVSSSIDSSNPPCPMSVALIVIGDELLKGMTPDSNIISAARALRANNVTLARVSIISDDSQDILEEIQRVTKEVSWKLVCHICAYTFLYHALMMIAFTLYLKGRCSDNEWWCWSNT